MSKTPPELPPAVASLMVGARYQVPLAPLTTWRIGGSAACLWRPPSLAAAAELLAAAQEAGVRVFFLGRGSNLLIADAGLPGITLDLRRAFQELAFTEETVTVGGGVYLPYLAGAAARRGWRGFEFFMGIPGTVGAAVRGNAGTGPGQETADLVRRVAVLRPGQEVSWLAAAALNFGYRTSVLARRPQWLVVAAELAPRGQDDPAAIVAEQRRLLAARRAKFPADKLTCGSVFKNPPGGPPAGWLIEQAGFKGRAVGDAQVSARHANFIINRGQATAAQVQALINSIQEEVWRRFGLVLEREVVFLPDDYQTAGRNG